MIKQVLGFLRFCEARFGTSNKALFFSTAITAFFSIVSAVIMPVLQKNIIAGVQTGAVGGILLFSMLGISFISIICSVYESLALNKLSVYLQNHLHRELFGNAIRSGSKIITTRGSGAFISGMFGDSERISGLITTNYFSFFMMFISSLIIIAITITWSPLFAAVVAPVYILSVLVIIFSNNIYTTQFSKGRECVTRLNPHVLERIENRLSILGFADVSAVEDKLFSEFETRDKHFRRAYAALALSKTAVEALKTIGLIALFLLSMAQIQSGELNIAAFVAMLSYYAGIFIPISAVQNITHGMSGFKMHHERIRDDLNKTPATALPKNKKLCFDRCSFAYDNGGAGGIDNLSFAVDKRIGLVGLSGEGKTTAVKLLFGGISPRQGACLLGGVETANISKAVLYSFIRLYNQDPELFDDTLEYNITLGKTPLSGKEYAGKVEAYITRLRECVISIKKRKYAGAAAEAAKELFLLSDIQARNHNLLAGIAEEMESARQMFETFAEILASRKYYDDERYESIIQELGIAYLSGRNLGQRGSKVSGGEKNKVCLARFLLPSHKGFYIIDEPLTSIDAISEERCIKAISLYLDCPGIIISHKLNMIRTLSDYILVLEDGKITESGTHSGLIEKGGLYARLYDKFTGLK